LSIVNRFQQLKIVLFYKKRKITSARSIAWAFYLAYYLLQMCCRTY